MLKRKQYDTLRRRLFGQSIAAIAAASNTTPARVRSRLDACTDAIPGLDGAIFLIDQVHDLPIGKRPDLRRKLDLMAEARGQATSIKQLAKKYRQIDATA